MRVISRSALAVIAALSAGIAYATFNTNWFDVLTSYGTNGVSAPTSLPNLTAANAVDEGDSSNTTYTLLSAPSIVRRTSTGAIDTSFGAEGYATSFENSANVFDQFLALCIDPVTHYLVVVGTSPSPIENFVERLQPPDASGAAALDTTFNAQGATPGVVVLETVYFGGNIGCHVTPEESIFIAGPNGAAVAGMTLVKLNADGTPDTTFGSGGVSGLQPPNGEVWEGATIEDNSAQSTVPDILILGDTYPMQNSSATTAAVIAIDRCTGAPDQNFNGDGFLSASMLDGLTFSAPITAAITDSGEVVGAFIVSTGTPTVDLIGWNYPLTSSDWLEPTAQGTLQIPSGLTVASLGAASPVRQSDGSLRLSAQDSSNQQSLFALTGDPTLGFTVGAASVVKCNVAVPNVVGLTQAAATTAITNVGLVVGTVTMKSSTTVPAGDVISQQPFAGQSAAPGSGVDLAISTGNTASGGGGGGGGGKHGGGAMTVLDLAVIALLALWRAASAAPGGVRRCRRCAGADGTHRQRQEQCWA
jgi:PASTA domain